MHGMMFLPKVSVRFKAMLLQAVYVYGLLILGALAIIFNEFFWIPFFLFWIACIIIGFYMKCPKCKKLVYKNPVKIPFTKKVIWTYTFFVPYNCSNCGQDLRCRKEALDNNDT